MSIPHKLCAILVGAVFAALANPLHSMSVGNAVECKVYALETLLQVMPEIKHPFAEGEVLQICRLPPSGEESYFLASVIAREAHEQRILCSHTSRRLFLNHNTPEEKRFTLEPPEGRGFLAEPRTYASFSTSMDCPMQYDDSYAVISGATLQKFAAIYDTFNEQVRTKDTALAFWRYYGPEKPNSFGPQSYPDEYSSHQAVLKSIERQEAYEVPTVTRLTSSPFSQHRLIVATTSYSAAVELNFDRERPVLRSATLFPKRSGQN